MIPVCEPLFGIEEGLNLQRCLDTNWIAGGKFVEQFEQEWAKYCERRYGIAVSNGTAALQVALAALELPYGSEVIIPSFTIMSCALAAVHNNLKPVFVDVEPDTWCLNPNLLRDAITSRTKAIMPVHMYGHPADMEAITKFAQEYGLYVIEDAAQAHGAEYQMGKNRFKAGSTGHLSCFSFYTNKIITTGEGGMILTDSVELAEKLRSLRNLCFGRGDNRFRHVGIGYNFRMTDLQAAIGVAQLRRVELTVDKKRRLAESYRELLQLSGVIQHPIERSWAKNVYWMYGIVLEQVAQPVMVKLRQMGVETRPFFRGLHRQPTLTSTLSFPITDWLTDHGLYLPSGVAITYEQQQQVAAALKEALDS